MNITAQGDSNIDWNEVIHHLFYQAWEYNSPVDITNYTYRIRHHFNLEAVIEKLESYIEQSEDRDVQVKYHTAKLKILTERFVITLLQLSDDGKMLTSHNIETAKHILLEKQPCDYGL